MLFSVVIPTYNRAYYIRDTLESLRAQKFTDFETIVVDDGSTDGTLELLREYSWVKVLQQQNKGPGVARNYGVSLCSGKYIAFLDSDDVWFPWTLSTFAEVIQKYDAPNLVAAKLEMFWENQELEQIRRAPLQVDVFSDYFETNRNRYFVGACMMIVSKPAFEVVGGFIEKQIYAEDCDLALRFGLVSGFVQILAPVTLGYRQHPNSARKNYELIYAGMNNLIESERLGRYPGGALRKKERLQLVTVHIRPVSFECLRHGKQRRAWRLYWKTFEWHLYILRWKYILGFPAIALCQFLKQLKPEKKRL